MESLKLFVFSADEPCCGSQMTSPSVRPLSPFQRQLPPYTISFTQEDINSIQAASVGRVADLVVEVSSLERHVTVLFFYGCDV